jgi:hypothetical protein
MIPTMANGCNPPLKRRKTMPKTPDEIKKGLECCNNIYSCPNCPYDNGDESWGCTVEKNADALALIQQLQAENEKKDARIQQLEAERDALLKYITDSTWAACDICKHGIDGASVLDCKHIREVGVPCFEWRGVQKEE